MEFFKKKWVLAIVVILAVGLIAVFFYFLESAAKTSYEFAEAKKGEVKKIVSATGAVKSTEAVGLSFEKIGKVAAINVQVGDQVKAGQQLAILNQTDYSDQVGQAMASLEIVEASLSQAEANLKKEKKKKTELVNTHQSKYTVDVQKAQIKSAQAAVDIEQAKIEKAQIDLKYFQDQHQKIVLTSPINGVVSEKNIEVGETAGPTETAIWVFKENDFKVEAGVSQVDVSEVKVGEKTRMTFDSCLAGDVVESQVVSIDPAETQSGGGVAYKTTFEIKKIPDCMKPGATANVEIVAAERENVLVVPSSSIIKRNSQHFVLVEDEKQGLAENEVKIGLEGSNGMTEVLSGIEEGERVVSFSK